MPTPHPCTAAQAVERLEPTDTLAVPLGPGQPKAFLHALAQRDDWLDLEIFGALLTDLFPIFAKPGVRMRSGFFGPVERALRAAGHDVVFVPADFRRFARIAEHSAPRVMARVRSPKLPRASPGLRAWRGMRAQPMFGWKNGSLAMNSI